MKRTPFASDLTASSRYQAEIKNLLRSTGHKCGQPSPVLLSPQGTTSANLKPLSISSHALMIKLDSHMFLGDSAFVESHARVAVCTQSA